MSQPPQQPGPYGGQQPGYGYQPGPGQQPGGYPQQGGYPPGGGYPQQGGYPQTGPQPQQPPGGYNPYGQPAQYGQQPPYGYGPPGGTPTKSKLPWILGGGGVLVIAAVVVLILVLTGGSDSSSPQGVAEATVKAINDRDVDAGRELDCNKSGDMGDFDINVIPKDLKAELATNAKESGDTAQAQIKMTTSGRSVTGLLKMSKKDGKWCVSGFDPVTGGSGSGGG